MLNRFIARYRIVPERVHTTGSVSTKYYRIQRRKGLTWIDQSHAFKEIFTIEDAEKVINDWVKRDLLDKELKAEGTRYFT